VPTKILHGPAGSLPLVGAVPVQINKGKEKRNSGERNSKSSND
jgi:hypothetical protein